MPTAADVAGLRSLLADLTGQASDDLAALWRTWQLDDPQSVTDLAAAAVIELAVELVMVDLGGRLGVRTASDLLSRLRRLPFVDRVKLQLHKPWLQG